MDQWTCYPAAKSDKSPFYVERHLGPYVYFSLITARIELRPSRVVNKRSSIELHHQLSHNKPHYLTYYVIFCHIIFDNICEFSCLYL